MEDGCGGVHYAGNTEYSVMYSIYCLSAHSRVPANQGTGTRGRRGRRVPSLEEQKLQKKSLSVDCDCECEAHWLGLRLVAQGSGTAPLRARDCLAPSLIYWYYISHSWVQTLLFCSVVAILSVVVSVAFFRA